jgi:hypothetical protein
MEAQMAAFIALYRGETVCGAQLVAVTADPQMVEDFAAKLITGGPENGDPKPDLRLVEQDHDIGA